MTHELDEPQRVRPDDETRRRERVSGRVGANVGNPGLTHSFLSDLAEPAAVEP